MILFLYFPRPPPNHFSVPKLLWVSLYNEPLLAQIRSIYNPSVPKQKDRIGFNYLVVPYSASTRLVCSITVNRKPCQNSSAALIFFTLMGCYTLKIRAPLDPILIENISAMIKSFKNCPMFHSCLSCALITNCYQIRSGYKNSAVKPDRSI